MGTVVGFPPRPTEQEIGDDATRTALTQAVETFEMEPVRTLDPNEFVTVFQEPGTVERSLAVDNIKHATYQLEKAIAGIKGKLPDPALIPFRDILDTFFRNVPNL